MKSLILTAGCAVLAVLVVRAIAADLPEVTALRNGFYVSTVDLDGRMVKSYMVDTRAQLCFFSDRAIPCENLKLRDEWKDIISWTADQGDACDRTDARLDRS